MKRSLRKSRSTRWRLLRRRVFDWPAILIGLSGASLWALWPTVGRSTPTPHPLPEPRVIAAQGRGNGDNLHLSPVVFALPSTVGFRAEATELGVPDMRTPPRVSTPHYLARDLGDSLAAADATVPARDVLAADVDPSLQGYRLPAPPVSVFASLPDRETSLRVETEGALSERGFTVTDAARSDILSAGGWEVVLQVYVGPDGDVAHVFLEKGCDRPLIHEKVIRMVSRGRLAEPGGECRGRVVVRCGRRLGGPSVVPERVAPEEM